MSGERRTRSPFWMTSSKSTIWAMKKVLLTLLLLTWPAYAGLSDLRITSDGCISLDSATLDPEVRFVALEGRDQSSGCWIPLASWETDRAPNGPLLTRSNYACLEYRLVLFGSDGFLSSKIVAPMMPEGSG